MNGGSVNSGALCDFGEAQPLPLSLALGPQRGDQLVKGPVVRPLGSQALSFLISLQVDLTAFIKFPQAGLAPVPFLKRIVAVISISRWFGHGMASGLSLFGHFDLFSLHSARKR